MTTDEWGEVWLALIAVFVGLAVTAVTAAVLFPDFYNFIPLPA